MPHCVRDSNNVSSQCGTDKSIRTLIGGYLVMEILVAFGILLATVALGMIWR